MELKIEHDADKGRFFAIVDGETGVLDYRLSGTTMTIVHTGVPKALEGRGIAAQLSRAAFETARANGWKVVPACSYAESYARKHTEYADLILR